MASNNGDSKLMNKQEEQKDLSTEVNRTVDEYLEAKYNSLRFAPMQAVSSSRTLPLFLHPTTIDIDKVSQVRAALPHIRPKTAVMGLQGVGGDPERAIAWLKQGSQSHWNDFHSPYGFEFGENIPFPMPGQEEQAEEKENKGRNSTAKSIDQALEKQRLLQDEAVKALKEMKAGEDGTGEA